MLLLIELVDREHDQRLGTEDQHRNRGEPHHLTADRLGAQPGDERGDQAATEARQGGEQGRDGQAARPMLRQDHAHHAAQHGVVVRLAQDAALAQDVDAEELARLPQGLRQQRLDHHHEQDHGQQQGEIAGEQIGIEARDQRRGEQDQEQLREARPAVGQDAELPGGDRAEPDQADHPEEQARQRLQDDQGEQAEQQEGRIEVERNPERDLDRARDHQDAEQALERAVEDRLCRRRRSRASSTPAARAIGLVARIDPPPEELVEPGGRRPAQRRCAVPLATR